MEARKKKVAVYMEVNDAEWWSNRAWQAHQSTSVFLNDQLKQMKHVIQEQERKEKQAAMENMAIVANRPSLKPYGGTQGK